MTNSKANQAKKKNAARSHTYLEKLVSQTKKFKVEELLDLYSGWGYGWGGGWGYRRGRRWR